MRDIARNFQALPLVSWMVWMAMAAIAAPVMALSTDSTENMESTFTESMLNAAAAEEIPLSTAKFEAMLAQRDEMEEPAIRIQLTDEAPLEAPLTEDSEDADVIIQLTDEAQTPASTDTGDALPVQVTDADELASPADPFFFDEDAVVPPQDGVLAPLSETEALPEGLGTEEAALDDGPLTPPQLKLQTAAIQEGDDFSARARVYGHYFLRSNVAVVGAVDLSTGNAFSDTDSTGFNISELFVVASPPNAPELRGAVGLIELTSFFDRNSFAKDSLTHFINPVFQTNPALAATQLESQPAALLHWRPIDEVILKAATFSSGGFSDLNFDAIVGEVGVNLGNLIVRGTYVSSTDNGDRDGIQESFQIERNGVFGPQEGDREVAYGINAEWFIPELNAGLFGRYGYHRNTDLDISGNTYSFGVNFLDLFIEDDRFGVGYGRQLSDNDRRQGKRPDVLETFYDIRLAPNARAAISWQLRDEFSESVLGFRIRADWDLLELFD